MPTETVNPRFTDIDTWPTADAVDAMLEGQMAAIAAVRPITGEIAAAADAAAQRLSRGGRIIYVGAGTSGRVAAQDGVELTPTYGWAKDKLAFVIAGGLDALVWSAEGAEDDADKGAAEIETLAAGPDDVVIGVAASGRTPFTIAALNRAGSAGALTIAVTNNAGSPLAAACDFGLCAETGGELVAGSTRMKAGTAQKAVLNLLSTAVMMRLGRVYRGLMVNMVVSNAKLRRRAGEIVAALSGAETEAADHAVDVAEGDIPTAVLICHGLEPADAAALLTRHGGDLRRALNAMGAKAPA